MILYHQIHIRGPIVSYLKIREKNIFKIVFITLLLWKQIGSSEKTKFFFLLTVIEQIARNC